VIDRQWPLTENERYWLTKTIGPGWAAYNAKTGVWCSKDLRKIRDLGLKGIAELVP